MSVPSRSGFKAVIGSFADIFRTAGAMPGTYVALFVIGAAQSFVYLSIDKTGKLTGQYTSETLIGDGISFLSCLVLIPFGVILLRYFTRAAPVYPSNLFMLCLRVIGWSILLGLIFFISFFGISIAAGIGGALAQQAPVIGIVLGVLVVIAFLILCWIGLRMALFFPMIARGEPSPIFGSFRQTKGWAFYVFRTLFFAFLLSIPIFGALLFFQMTMFGISLADLKAGNVTAMLEAQPLNRSAVLAVLGGFGSTIVTTFYAALVGRMFRAVRGIG